MRELPIYFISVVLNFYVKLGNTDTTPLENVTISFATVIASFDNTLANQPNVSSLIGLKGLPFNDLAAKYGHPVEQYEVTTEDGYKLTVFRLPGKKEGLPVLLFHGIADCADTWIIRGNTSLSITLANDGRDVWLANNRGNRYARGHTYLTPDDPRYWNFSFHEIGIYDLAATINLVLNKTGAKKLNAFGHSQGNTIFYVLLSTRPEYNAKVNVMTALAPICYLQNVPPPLSVLIEISPQLALTANILGITNVFGDTSIENTAIKVLSQKPVINYVLLVDGILFPLAGFDSEELEPEFLPTLGLHYPTWTSIKSLKHFGQVGLRKDFAQFDYGAPGNLAIYNSVTPPEYDLSKVTTKVVLLAGANDKLSSLQDVAILRERLPNIVQYVVNPREQMNHVDYVWGRNAPSYLYNYIFNVLETYK